MLAVDETGAKFGHKYGGETGSYDDIASFLRPSDVPQPPTGNIAAASHMEARISWAMRARAIQNASAVINKLGGVCRGDFSCTRGGSGVMAVGGIRSFMGLTKACLESSRVAPG
ncbi:DddA-like double-stranded DNA deaminase toxin [Streptacidiphilus sp. N1-3]|uniref:DddA-like double-stranded DNA deaminase toxin n=1 Tax=Streptacidiphilus alkalitolerans TaxID=3342712 RepID=A0ABV6X344_9ACTN